jgi:hypothetical protein
MSSVQGEVPREVPLWERRGESRIIEGAGIGGSNVVKRWSDGWAWDLGLSPHIVKRRLDRGFSEVDLRCRMEGAKGLREADESGRWIVETKHHSYPGRSSSSLTRKTDSWWLLPRIAWTDP